MKVSPGLNIMVLSRAGCLQKAAIVALHRVLIDGDRNTWGR